jgi:RNA polymerase sigma-70 factor (ECF subfamily)
VALRFFPRLEDAEDVAQDTFVRAFLKLGKLHKGVPFENWVVRVAINLSLDRLRYSKRRPEHSISQLGEEESWLERFLGRESVDDGDRTAQNTEARNILDKVLPMISPRDQAILHLLYGEGMNSSEVAAVLGSSEVNIRVRAHRAKRALRKALEKLMEGRPGTHGS